MHNSVPAGLSHAIPLGMCREIAGNVVAQTYGYHLPLSVIMFRNGVAVNSAAYAWKMCPVCRLMNTCACTIERLPACPKPIVWTRFTEIAGNGAPTTCGYNLRMLMIMFRESVAVNSADYAWKNCSI